MSSSGVRRVITWVAGSTPSSATSPPPLPPPPPGVPPSMASFYGLPFSAPPVMADPGFPAMATRLNLVGKTVSNAMKHKLEKLQSEVDSLKNQEDALSNTTRQELERYRRAQEEMKEKVKKCAEEVKQEETDEL